MIRELLFGLVVLGTVGYCAFGVRMLIRALQNGGKEDHFASVPGRAKNVRAPGGSFWQRFSGPRTQASLFHYIKEEPEPSIWSDIDWSFLRHPLRSLKNGFRAPRTQASLFHYIVDEPAGAGQPFSWREFFRDIVRGERDPFPVVSLFPDREELREELAVSHIRKMVARTVSLSLHLVLFLLAALLVFRRVEPLPANENVVFVKNSFPMDFPFEGDGREGGGGGGGGKEEKMPASGGRMPATTPVQFAAPDPVDPQPLVPVEDLMSQAPSVQMPINIPQDETLPIGDVEAPPRDYRSSGPGSGGGIGTGRGTGIGSGSGPGVGPGSGGGMGGGSGGGIGSGVGPYVMGSGVTAPVAIYQPLPLYTEEARKSRVEGIVLIQAVIRKDGSVDSFRVLRGLGYGLDESAINTIATKWRFRPGAMHGVPVDVQANIEVTFRLY